MTTEYNADGHPRQDTLLPFAEIIFRCSGRGWHDGGDVAPYQLVWVQGIDGSMYPEDGFYCADCVSDADKTADEKGEALVTGPTLDEELKRRGMWHLVDDRWLESFDLTLQYHPVSHESKDQHHVSNECPYGKNVTERCWCYMGRPSKLCKWCDKQWARWSTKQMAP